MERMTVEQYRRHLQGKVNRAQGASFEETISDACVFYDLDGEAYIEKTPEPMRPIAAMDRKRGIFKAVYTKAAQPDYKGTLAGGQSICFEAKHTTADRIKQDAITTDQWEALDKHQAMGAACFVLVSLGHRFYRVPWAEWKQMKTRFGRKYMNAADLACNEIPFEGGILKFLALSKGARSALDAIWG